MTCQPVCSHLFLSHSDLRRWVFQVFRCLVLLGLAGVLLPAQAESFGKRLLTVQIVDADTLLAFNELKPVARAPHTSALEHALAGDSVSWRGRAELLPMVDNPYTLVMRVKGHAPREGNALSLWLGGFEFLDADGNEQSVLDPVASLSRPDARAGESFELVAVAKRLSVSVDRSMTPVLSLNKLDNMVIESVTLEVWSGIGRSSFSQVFLGAPWLFGGLFMGALWWFWFRR